MRKLLTILSFLLANSCLGNSVDSIKTDSDVLLFLERLDPKFTSPKRAELKIFSTDELRLKLSCDSMLYKWNIRNWEKVDFNNDGRTDLIATVHWYDFDVFVAIDKGDNTFQLIRLSKDAFENCELGKTLKLNGEQLLLFYRYRKEFPYPEKNFYDFHPTHRIDTLLYKFGGFIEKMTGPALYQIQEIEYYTSDGWSGVSPVYSFKFQNDGDAYYQPNSTKQKKRISKDKSQQITGLIQYINIKQLRDRYLVARIDDTTIYLKITFRDGSIKQIEDFGMEGTFGLGRLYELLGSVK